MLKIRLRRMGAIRQPHYRIVVADARAPRDGRFFEILGHYNPRTEPATIQVDVAKYEEWKSKGAQPTEAVVRLVAQFTKGNMADTTQPAAGKTRNASRAGIQQPVAPAEAATADADAPMGDGMAEATRDDGEGSEAITGGVATSADAGVDNTDAPLLNADANPPAGAAEGQADTDTAS